MTVTVPVPSARPRGGPGPSGRDDTTPDEVMSPLVLGWLVRRKESESLCGIENAVPCCNKVTLDSGINYLIVFHG